MVCCLVSLCVSVVGLAPYLYTIDCIYLSRASRISCLYFSSSPLGFPMLYLHYSSDASAVRLRCYSERCLRVFVCGWGVDVAADVASLSSRLPRTSCASRSPSRLALPSLLQSPPLRHITLLSPPRILLSSSPPAQPCLVTTSHHPHRSPSLHPLSLPNLPPNPSPQTHHHPLPSLDHTLPAMVLPVNALVQNSLQMSGRRPAHTVTGSQRRTAVTGVKPNLLPWRSALRNLRERTALCAPAWV